MASAPSDPRTMIVQDPRFAVASPDLADAAAELVRVGFGIFTLGLGVALRTLDAAPTTVTRQPRPRLPVSDVADLVVGTAWAATRLSGKLAATGSRFAAPALRLGLRPPLVPSRLQPGHGVDLMIERWQRDRPETVRSVGHWSATALPGALDAVLGEVDVEQMVVAVLDSVNLDAVAAHVLRRVNVDELAAELLGRLDLAALATDVVSRLDLDPLIAAALERVDLTAVATKALAQMALAPVVSAALDQIDLTQLVMDNVNLERVVSGALEHLDLTQIVLHQVDLIGVAEYVIEGIDLPEIIRDSTGSVASEAVRGLRMQGVDADAAVARMVDRVLRRRRQRHIETEGERPLASDVPDDTSSARQP